MPARSNVSQIRNKFPINFRKTIANFPLLVQCEVNSKSFLLIFTRHKSPPDDSNEDFVGGGFLF